MKKTLSFLALLGVLFVALPGFAADQQPPLSRVDSMSDLPSRVSTWYSFQWQQYPVFTGIWTGLVVFAGLYCVSDSFKNRVRSICSDTKQALFGDIKCTSCQGNKPKPHKDSARQEKQVKAADQLVREGAVSTGATK